MLNDLAKENTPVLINLLATARYDQTPDFPIQFMTKGHLSMIREGEAMIEYTESIQDDDSGETMTAKVLLQLSGNRVTMTREGDVSNTMVFIPSHRSEGIYQTPYGSLNMGVYARNVDCRIGPDSGSVHLKYQLDIQGNYTSSNELHLEYHAE